MSVRSLLALLAAGTALGLPACGGASATRTFSPAALPAAADVPNSLRGQYVWNGVPPDPASLRDPDVYERLPWRELEPALGRFDFAAIRRGLARAAARGGRFGLRVYAYCPGCREVDAAPPGLPRDAANPRMVAWNSPRFLAAWSGLMRALGARFDPDPRLGWIDIGGYGSFGEWHLYRQPGTPITESNMRGVMRDVVEAFPDRQVLAMTVNPLMLADAVRLFPRVGLRVDCLGAGGLGGSALSITPPPALLRAALDRWRTAPIVTEWCYGTLGGTQDEYELGAAQVARYHVSLLSSGNFPSSVAGMSPAERRSFLAAVASAGFRYRVLRVTVPASLRAGGPLPIRSWWSNAGVAPTYDAWRVSWQLRRGERAPIPVCTSALRLEGLLPTGAAPVAVRDACAVPPGLPAGRYALEVSARAPLSDLPALRLAQHNRQADGSYRLGSLTVR